MQVSVESISTVEKRLKITIPAEEINQKVDSRLRELGKQVRLKGFRPGRIPFSVLKQRYGRQASQEVIQQATEESVQQAVTQESLQIAAKPRLEDDPVLDKTTGLQINALIDIYPEIGQIETSSISIERPDVNVTDDDVAEMVETLKQQKINWTEVNRKPKTDDQALVEYIAETDEGAIPKEGKHRMAIILGKSGFEDLEKAVSKMSAGDEKDVELEFPADYSEAVLAGKKHKVSLTLTKVQEGELPELDEEFVKSFGVDSGDAEELKSEIRNNLERELGSAVNTQLKTQLADRLLEMHEDLAVPESIVTAEAGYMLRQMLSGAEVEITDEMLGHFTEPARKRVRSGLLLGELAKQNSLAVDGARVRQAIEEVAQTYEDPAEVVQMYYRDQRLLQSMENSVLESQVVDWVVDHANVTDTPMSFQEAINAATKAANS